MKYLHWQHIIQKALFTCFYLLTLSYSCFTLSNSSFTLADFTLRPPFGGISYAPSAPTNFNYSKSDNAISVSWDWGVNDGGELEVFSAKTFNGALESQSKNTFSVLPCNGNCNLTTHFVVEVSEAGGAYRVVATTTGKIYHFTLTNYASYRFRVKAGTDYSKTEVGPRKIIYSDYLVGPVITAPAKPKLEKPSITPASESILSGTAISISSSYTIKYKLVNNGTSCDNGSWLSYTSAFNLTRSQRVCAKAIKSGWPDSDVVLQDYTILEQTSQFAALAAITPNNELEFEPVGSPTVSGVGTIKGQAGVDGGAATYHIPIELPPGRVGMQPEVSLNYSSRSGKGIAGVGWSLTAGSSITRCAATYAQDGFSQNPQYNSNDRLCLDGQRLIATLGSYGNSGTEYRTEIDSFTRVTQSGSLNGTSTWFKAEYKNGHVAYFGKTSNSRLVHGGKSAAYSWLIEYQHDATAKNYIHYKYEEFGVGETLLSGIAYTGNSVSSKGS
ncbi:SpvB/TcaC N-terminal domain-containing protein [Pseudoalteromonas sp. B131b]|uniref:SpvB/TcaC N-terminal domain-containing protein n=1 Tax=Pseudoalteromonas sp. B131b TaxID=630493 RepID=UPI00301D181A